MHLVALSLIAAISATPKPADFTKSVRPSIAQMLKNQVIIAKSDTSAANRPQGAIEATAAASIENPILLSE